ncbi:MAG: hypothetical protein KDB80_05885, partial [Planctomycetes bacterium]|nr:hypothetical protein [Planctomycetota bacterium]
TELYRIPLDPTRDCNRPVASEAGVFFWVSTPTPEIVGLEPWSGREISRVQVSQEVREFLGLDDYTIRDDTVQSRIRVTRDRIVIPSDPHSDTERPRCVAIGWNGEIQWRWSGNRSQQIEMLATKADRTVVLTTGHLQSQLTILDAHGQRAKSRDLGPRAKATNWDWDESSAPDILVITDIAETPRLTVMSLVDRKPFFQRTLDGVFAVVRRPIVTDRFVALPVRVRTKQVNSEHNARVLLIDYDDPLAREPSFVPLNNDTYFSTPMNLSETDGFIAIETPSGITLMTDEDPTKR